ncbi:unnamed protein product [Cyprideis torosa]|uniref:Uncharacterized protein n=1 Tax=Cyprideis torosa TaxID=163714 RepID=A0A7R8ZK39_9CRUS|nr:unnamed protein product [Cyprideis torosa]CAG0889943.1 unnamed protein product [Cyprideis torosa]
MTNRICKHPEGTYGLCHLGASGDCTSPPPKLKNYQLYIPQNSVAQIYEENTTINYTCSYGDVSYQATCQHAAWYFKEGSSCTFSYSDTLAFENRYFFAPPSETKNTWIEAQSYCMLKGGRLVMPESKHLLENLFKKFKSGNKEFYVGPQSTHRSAIYNYGYTYHYRSNLDNYDGYRTKSDNCGNFNDRNYNRGYHYKSYKLYIRTHLDNDLFNVCDVCLGKISLNSMTLSPPSSSCFVDAFDLEYGKSFEDAQADRRRFHYFLPLSSTLRGQSVALKISSCGLRSSDSVQRQDELLNRFCLLPQQAFTPSISHHFCGFLVSLSSESYFDLRMSNNLFEEPSPPLVLPNPFVPVLNYVTDYNACVQEPGDRDIGNIAIAHFCYAEFLYALVTNTYRAAYPFLLAFQALIDIVVVFPVAVLLNSLQSMFWKSPFSAPKTLLALALAAVIAIPIGVASPLAAIGLAGNTSNRRRGHRKTWSRKKDQMDPQPTGAHYLPKYHFEPPLPSPNLRPLKYHLPPPKGVLLIKRYPPSR